ncbi:hypothetical protein [Epibacterium ulvae]|uniref:hypothetical protein n=1 Tax=Epibacterium ulvae TaxID=1156985 RepID=UPI002493021B|nr:hypothetical protein [Epibacterium ulvae]
MGEPHLKARPSETAGRGLIEVDQAGYELLVKYMSRSQRGRKDDPQNFNRVKDRIDGLMSVLGIQMGWKGKK